MANRLKIVLPNIIFESQSVFQPDKAISDNILVAFETLQPVTYSILVNKEPKGHIIPSRGIRQWDPLSLYPFLLCSEGLNGLIQHVVDGGLIEGFSICRNSSKISHFFFCK